ncbi:MAG: phage portal protein [Trueperaceae bacterium]|nr:phage portal protein [Trueperaceae bacterium]
MNLLDKMWETTRLALLHSAVAVGYIKRTTDAGVRYSTKVIQADMLNITFAEDDPDQAAQYDLQDDELVSMEQYWYRHHEDAVEGDEWYTLHRRDWQLNATIEYNPVDLRGVQHPDDITWTEASRVEHDMGSVPVEYIRPFPLVGTTEGIPLFEDAEYDAADSINYTLSQLDRGIEYNQEPTQVFLGVELSDENSLQKGSGKSWALSSSTGGNVDAKLLELQGQGQRVALDYVNKLRDVIHDVSQVVRHDPQEAANVMSGTALKRMLAPTIARTHVIRPRIGRPFARLLRKAAVADGADRGTIVGVNWPPVVEPTENDKTQEQSRTIGAMDAGLINRRVAVENVAPMYGVENTEEHYQELQREEADGGTVETLPPLDDGTGEDEGA